MDSFGIHVLDTRLLLQDSCVIDQGSDASQGSIHPFKKVDDIAFNSDVGLDRDGLAPPPLMAATTPAASSR